MITGILAWIEAIGTMPVVGRSGGPASRPMPDAALIADLVSANHILYREGVVDGFGHISVRHDKNSDRFLLSRSIAPATVTASDIMEFDLEATPVDPKGRRSYLERFIHSEIYRARPDVQAIVHSHSTAVIPFGVTNTQLRPIFHMGGFLGEALAGTLGAAAFALLRGHGSVAVGASIKQVVYRAIYAEVNARVQAEAMRFGEITFLNDAEAANASKTNDENLDRPWQLWKKKLR